MAAKYPLVLENGQTRQIGATNWVDAAHLGAAGLAGQVQYHSSDRLAASATFVFDGASAQLRLYGDTDAPRLVIKGHSTQLSDLMQWRTFADALLVKVTGDGKVDAQDFTIGGVTIVGGGGGTDPPQGSYAPGSYTIATGKFRIAVKRQQFTTTQRLTIQGTARLSIYN